VSSQPTTPPADATTTIITDPPVDREHGLYRVTAVGVCYAFNGEPTNIQLALQHRVVELVDSEAERLLLLGCVKAASEADIANESLRAERDAAARDAQLHGPTSNPYGGSISGTTLEAHAAEQIALAKKSGAIPETA
jgi:hypothetical protein